MSNDSNFKNGADSQKSDGRSPKGAQVLPFRRQLKTLKPMPPKASKAAWAQSKRAKKAHKAESHPVLGRGLQLALLTIAVLLILHNCKTV